jgi:hypothetical protein
VEFGTHDELMVLGGRYSYLYGLQTDALADTPSTNGDAVTNGVMTNGVDLHNGVKADDVSHLSVTEIDAEIHEKNSDNVEIDGFGAI